MKPITAFYLTHCPYCRNAKAAIEELITENQVYGTIPITWYEESENPDAVKGHTYYYVPSLFIGHENYTKHSQGKPMKKSKNT